MFVASWSNVTFPFHELFMAAIKMALKVGRIAEVTFMAVDGDRH